MITDLDSHSADRASPLPNTHDQVAHEAVMAKGTNSVNYVTPATNQTLTDDAKNGQFTIVQVGSFTTTSPITISNPGVGSYGNFSQVIYSVPHNLGFVPGVTAYEQNSANQYTPMPYTNYLATSSSAVWYSFSLYVDSSNVYVDLNGVTYSASVTFQPGFIFKWYLLQQPSS